MEIFNDGFSIPNALPQVIETCFITCIKNSIIQTSVTYEKEDGCVKALIKSKPFIIKLLLVN